MGDKKKYCNFRYIFEVISLIPKIWIKHIMFRRDLLWRRYFWDKLGSLPLELRQITSSKKCLWFHATSEGDIISLDSFLKELKKSLPDYSIIFSTDNFGPFQMLKSMEAVDEVFFPPWDTGFICQKVLRQIKPQLFAIIESAQCPVLLRLAKKMKSKTMLISGFLRKQGLKEESYKFSRPFSQNIFNYIDFIGVQTELDADNIISSAGAPKNKVKVTGSLKMDLEYALIDERQKRDLMVELGIFENAIIIVAGPIHKEEEEIILDVYQEILSVFSKAILIIAPRYLRRVGEIEKLILKRNFKFIKRSVIQHRLTDEKIIILDTFGELPKIYGLAAIVILGGSLSPPGGGHNILEPAVHQKPIFFGMYMHCREEFLEVLKSSWAGMQVKDKRELAANILYLLNHPERLKEVGVSMSKIIKDKKEIFSKNIKAVKETLGIK